VKDSGQRSVISGCFRRSRPGVLKVTLAAAACTLLMPSTAPAQQAKPWEKIPIPPLHAFHPQQPKRIALKNGIVLFLQEDHELPFVSGSVLIPGGSRDEDPAKCGLIDLYGQTWRTSGTEKMSGDAMDDLLESKAAHIETGGDDDSTALSWDSLKGDTDFVYNLAMDLLFHPKFNLQKLRLAQQQEATGIVRRNDNEAQIAGREAAKLVYGANSPYARQPELATIAHVAVADLQGWHDKTIDGKLIVSVSGDFDPAAMEAKLRATFESLPQAKPLPVRHDTFPGPTPGVYFINKEDVNQSQVAIVGLGTDRRNPEVPSLSVMNDVFAGGFASRLFQKVRTELGLAYEVGGGMGAGWDHPATFQAVVLTKSASTVDAIQQTYKVLDGLVSRPFTEEELKRAKDNILNSFLFRYDTKDKVLAERVRLEFYGYPPDYLETYKAALEKVTVADLDAAAKKYIHPDRYAVLVVGNGPEIKPGLDELHMGPVHNVDITIPQPGAPAGAQGGAEKQE
jgi:zinc protease